MSSCSRALRKTIRPMRPKPLMPTYSDGGQPRFVSPSACCSLSEAYLDNHVGLFRECVCVRGGVLVFV